MGKFAASLWIFLAVCLVACAGESKTVEVTVEVTATPLAPATSTTAPPTEAVPLTAANLKNIVYANVAGRETRLDVYLPDDTDEADLPVVIVVPGVLQSKFNLMSFAEAIAERGAIVYVPDIRNHEFPVTLSVERIGCAVRHARATAEDYGGDPDEITLVGNSMGANTGIIAALDGTAFEGDCAVDEGSATFDKFVGYEGVYHLATAGFDYRWDHRHLKDEDPELWQAIDPYSYIGLRPELEIRLIHGVDIDSAWYDIPPEVSEELYQALLDAGYDVEMTLVEDSPHGALTATGSDGFDITVEQVMELALD
jgi:hypothetical protein